jgi:hypothetical protein
MTEAEKAFEHYMDEIIQWAGQTGNHISPGTRMHAGHFPQVQTPTLSPVRWAMLMRKWFTRCTAHG